MSNYTVITSDYLEHSRRDSIPNRFYFSHISNPTVTNGKIEFNVAFVYGLHKSNGSSFGRVIYTPRVYFVYDTGNRPSREQLAKEIKPAIVKMALDYATPVSKEESNRAIDEAYKWVQRAPFSNTPISSKPFQTVKDEIRHSEDLEIIDVSDTLQHAQHEGYYSPNNTANKATPYIFEKLVKSSAGNQIGARFKGQGDRQWVEIFVPTVDFTPNMQNLIALFNAEKGNVKIREEEMRKAARLLTNFFNSPSLPGNEKMTTYVRKPKSLKHALFTEVYDMDDYLEHHGILGMKWGVRRYQNEDGSLTDLGRKRYNVKATRAQLENAKTDAEKRLILTKSANKVTADMLGGIAGYAGGLMATAGLAAAFQTPLALIPAAVGVTNFARSVIYGTYKGLKLSELAAEFDVSTNIARSISNDNKPIKMLYDPSTTPEQAKELDKMYSQYTGRPVESTIRQPSNNSTNRFSSGPRYTPEQQREKLQTAKNNDRYDLDFLEFMQNTKISYDDNKTAMDKAYKEYLKDPEAFATDPDFYKKYPYA